MDYIFFLREKYGSVYTTDFPDGRVVPWKPLGIGDFLYYDQLVRSAKYPPSFIENEIFKKCVLDEYLVSEINTLRAGIVTTVVDNIMMTSGPSSMEDLDAVMNYKRMETSNILTSIINLISMAYPSYTMEELYAMDYETLMTRAATAERKLLETGILKEPVPFLGHKQKKRSRRDEFLMRQREKEQGDKEPNPRELRERFMRQRQQMEMPEYFPPAPPPSDKTIVITEDDIVEHELVYTGHEKDDKLLLGYQMAKDTAGFYKEYIDQIKRGEKVQILSPAEREAAARERMKKHKKTADKIAQQKRQKSAEERQLLAQKLKERAAKKRR